MATASTTFTATACTDCCGIEVACASMECRTRGGTASLCGYAEWTGYESTPPKKYRTKTLSGSLFWCYYSGTPCTTKTSSFGYTWGGTCYYNASTCALTQSGTSVLNHGDATCALTTDDPATTACGITGATSSLDETLTSTVRTLVGNGNCVNDSGWRQASGTATDTLSVEDTEADALSRLLAGAGGTWSAWSAASSTTCLARWQNRTSGFDLIYQEAQWRIVFTGLSASTAYSVQVKMYRRTYGSGGYTLYQTQTAMGTSDGSGNLTLSGDVPNAYGYETYAACA